MENERLVLQRGRNGGVQSRKAKEDGITAEQQRLFLEHFAGTCNVTASCNHAGVKKVAIYKRRAENPVFRKAWAAAQAQGYAALEAELVRRGLEFVASIGPDEASAATLAGMDAKLILTILQQQAKRLEREPGDIQPRRSDLQAATERLAKLMKRMRLEIEVPPAAGEQA